MAENNSQDPRVRRTVSRLRKALMELIIEKGYQHLTVQEIVDRADVNRTTFYRQFRDKNDLMHTIIDDIVQEMLIDIGEPVKPAKKELTFVSPHQLAGFFKRAVGYQDLYNAMVNEEGTPAFRYQFIKTFEEVLYRRIKQSGINVDRLPIPISMLVTYLTNSYMAILYWWLSHHEEYSAEFVAEKVIELMMDGMHDALDLQHEEQYWK